MNKLKALVFAAIIISTGAAAMDKYTEMDMAFHGKTEGKAKLKSARNLFGAPAGAAQAKGAKAVIPAKNPSYKANLASKANGYSPEKHAKGGTPGNSPVKGKKGSN